MISLLSQHRLHIAGQMNHLIYIATALRHRSCKKLKEPPPPVDPKADFHCLSSLRGGSMNLMLSGEDIRLFMVY